MAEPDIGSATAITFNEGLQGLWKSDGASTTRLISSIPCTAPLDAGLFLPGGPELGAGEDCCRIRPCSRRQLEFI